MGMYRVCRGIEAKYEGLKILRLGSQGKAQIVSQ